LADFLILFESQSSVGSMYLIILNPNAARSVTSNLYQTDGLVNPHMSHPASWTLNIPGDISWKLCDRLF